MVSSQSTLLHADNDSTSSESRPTSPTNPSSDVSKDSDSNSCDEAILSVKSFFEEADADNKIRVLLAMSIGLQGDLLHNERLETHVKKGRIEKSLTSVRGRFEYNDEIKRRGSVIISDVRKQPRPASWSNDKRLQWLVEHPINGEEKDWVFKKFEELMDEMDRKAAEEIVPGSKIRLTNIKCVSMKPFFWKSSATSC